MIKNTFKEIMESVKTKKWTWLYIITLLLTLTATVIISGQKQQLSSHAATVSLVIDQQVGTNQNSPASVIKSPVFTTTAGNELIVVFLASDGLAGASQKFTSVSGGGLTFSLAARANTQKGTAEVWYAYSEGVLTNVAISATRYSSPYRGSMRVVTFKGARSTLGSANSATGTTGEPFVSLTTTVDGSRVLGVGNDPTRSIDHVAGPNQQIVQQFLAKKSKQTFWFQQFITPIPNAATIVHLNNTSPTNDAWNMVAIEVVPLPVAIVTPSVTPTTQPTPVGSTPTPTPNTITPTRPSGTGYIPDGWPTTSNTGWQHTGVTLTAYGSGEIVTITTPGTVLDGKDIRSMVRVAANNVTIKRSRIMPSFCSGTDEACYGITLADGFSGLVLEDVEITKSSSINNIDRAVVLKGPPNEAKNATLRRVYVHGTHRGVYLGNDTLVEDSYIDDFTINPPPGAHTAAVTARGVRNVVLRHNTIGLPPSEGNSGGFAIYESESSTDNHAPSENFTVESNLFNGGSGCVTMFNTPRSASSYMIYRNNLFGVKYWSDCGIYYPVDLETDNGVNFTWSNNTWYAPGQSKNGQALPRPTFKL